MIGTADTMATAPPGSTLRGWSDPQSQHQSDHSRASNGNGIGNVDLSDEPERSDVDSGDDLTKTTGGSSQHGAGRRRRQWPPDSAKASVNGNVATATSSQGTSQSTGSRSPRTKPAYFSTGRDFYDDGYYGSSNSAANTGSNKSQQSDRHRTVVTGGEGSMIGDGDCDFNDDEEEASIVDRLDFSPHLWGREQDLYKLMHIYQQIRAGPPPQAQVTTSGGAAAATHAGSNQNTTTNSSNSNLISTGNPRHELACHTVMVRGVSGTGKSTLVQQFYSILQQNQGNYVEDTARSISTSNIRHIPNNDKDNTERSDSHPQSILDGNSTSTKQSPSKVPFFVSGKYNDEFSGGAGCQNNPLSAIADAFSEFCQSLVLSLDGDDGHHYTEFDRVQQRIQQALGPEAQELLVGLIPGLSPLFQRGSSGIQKEDGRRAEGNDEAVSPLQEIPVSRKTSLSPPAASSTSVNALNQLKYIFATFCNAIASQERPVVLFLDDLQWCDDASLELLQSLLTDRSLEYFMFIGAYRSDEVEDGLASPGFVQMLRGLENMTSNNNTVGSELTSNYLEYIDVHNLTFQDLASFVGGALGIERLENASNEENRTILELTTIIYGKTGGNIFFSKQILEQLHREGYIEFSRLSFRWECHLDEKDDLDALLSDDVLKTVTTKIQNAPADLQRVLVVAAYTRSTVDIDILWWLLLHDKEMTNSDVSDLSRLTKILDDAVLEGLLSNNMGSKNYSFAHDRIQQAAFALIPKGQERDQFRLDIGMKLLEIARKAENPVEIEWMLFAAADHLNAVSFLYRKHHDRMVLTSLNLQVGELAAKKLAYDTASKYLMLVMQDLNSLSSGHAYNGQNRSNPWESHYDLTLQAYRLLADVQLRQGRYETGAGFGNSVLQNARCLEDRLPTQMAMTKAYGRQEEHKDSVAMSTRALRELRLYPRSSTGLYCSLVKNLLYVKRYFKNNTDTQFLNLPRMTNTHTLAAMDFLGSNGYHNYLIGNMVGFLADTLMMLRLTFKHGICGVAGVALTGYALFCNNLNEMEGAYRFSDLARKVLEDTRAKELECLQLFVVAHWITGWKEPHTVVLQCFERAYRSGMETGDFENAFLSRTAGFHHEYTAGYHLGPLNEKYCELVQKLESYKIKSILVMTVEQRRKIQHLKGDIVPPLDVEELSRFGPVKNDESEIYGLLYGYLCRLELAVYFGNLQFGEKMVKKLKSVSDSDKSYTTNSLRLYFFCLTYTSLARKSRKQSLICKARRHLRELTNLCNIKGMNSWHKCLIMEAHLKSATGWSESRVEAGYDLAIQASLNSGHQQDAALACQLAGEYFASLTTETEKKNLCQAECFRALSRKYLNRARILYNQWGAYAMVKHLETKHASLLKVTVQDEETAEVTLEVCDPFGESPPIQDGLASGILTTQSDRNDEVSVITELTNWREPAVVASPFSASFKAPNEDENGADHSRLQQKSIL